MNSIISKLYYGEINPSEKPASNTKRCIENRELICSTEEQLLEQFPTCKELLDTYTDALHIEGNRQPNPAPANERAEKKYSRLLV